jgi:hypothetical protein
MHNRFQHRSDIAMTQENQLTALRRKLRCIDRVMKELQQLQRMDAQHRRGVSKQKSRSILYLATQSSVGHAKREKRKSPPKRITAKILHFPAKESTKSNLKEGLDCGSAKNA